MLLRRFTVAILISTLLHITACSPASPETPDADELIPVSEMGVEIRSDLRGPPPCELVGGCPVDLPVTRPIVYRFWGASANDVWAVGKGGLTMNWNGTSWRRFGNPATGDLWAVWGTAANDIWAVGENATIIHWNGSAWSKTTGLMTTAGLNDVWGISASDVWTVGESGTILHWDGTKWSIVSIPYINGFMAVWGAAAKDVWVGGEAGLLLRWDGTKMNEVATSSIDTIWRIRGSGVDNAYLTTDVFGSPQIWDGTKWTRSTASAYGPEIWVVGEDKVWLAATIGLATPTPYVTTYYWNGLIWTEKVPVAVGIVTAVWVTDTDGWIGTASGQLARYNGTSWSRTW